MDNDADHTPDAEEFLELFNQLQADDQAAFLRMMQYIAANPGITQGMSQDDADKLVEFFKRPN